MENIEQYIVKHFSRFATFEPEETIICKGDNSSEVYFILSGSVRIANFSENGREVWHSELETGTFIGEMAALSGTTRTTNAIAQTPAKLAVLSRDEFFKLIRHDSDIAIWIMQELVKRVGEQTEKLSELVAKKVSDRVKSILYDLALACEHSSENRLVIRPVPNISALAVRLNTDRETVSREISKLKKAGIIEKTKEQIRVLKPRELNSQA